MSHVTALEQKLAELSAEKADWERKLANVGFELDHDAANLKPKEVEKRKADRETFRAEVDRVVRLLAEKEAQRHIAVRRDADDRQRAAEERSRKFLLKALDDAAGSLEAAMQIETLAGQMAAAIERFGALRRSAVISGKVGGSGVWHSQGEVLPTGILLKFLDGLGVSELHAVQEPIFSKTRGEILGATVPGLADYATALLGDIEAMVGPEASERLKAAA